MRPALLVPALLAGLGLAVSGCTDDTAPAPVDPTTSPSALPTATALPRPNDGACYDLDYDQAVSPTVAADPVACRSRHTAQTFQVGPIDNLVDGHLLAVDSRRVQQQVATTCPEELRGFVGGSVEQLRLSMLRAVWFTPSVAESDEGAGWYRCDVVGLAGAEDLATVTGSLRGVLDDAAGRERWAMCGTANPDDAGFERVPCSERHTWVAISVVDLADLGERYPGASRVTDAGEQPCEDAGAQVADDPLDYQWAYEGPDAEQWDAGQRFGRCWAPSTDGSS